MDPLHLAFQTSLTQPGHSVIKSPTPARLQRLSPTPAATPPSPQQPPPEAIALGSIGKEPAAPTSSSPPSQHRPDDGDVEQQSGRAGQSALQSQARLPVQSFWNPYMSRWRVGTSCLAALGQGMNDAAAGALLSYIEEDYNIDYTIVSLIFIANAVGFVTAAFYANRLTVRLGRAKTFMIAELMIMAGYIAIVCRPPYAVVVAAFFITGNGLAVALAMGQVFNAILANGTTMTGLYQGSYGIGGTISPLIATSMVASGKHWSTFYTVVLALAAFNLIGTGWAFWSYEDDLARLSGTSVDDVSSTPPVTTSARGGLWNSFMELVGSRTVLLGSFFIFAYQGSEVSISGWVIQFLINYRGGDPTKVGYVTSGFWAGITLGRFILSPLIPRLRGPRPFVLVVVCGALALQVLTWLVTSVIGNAVSVSLAGFLLGPISPAATALFVQLLPSRLQVRAIAFIGSIGSSGGAFMPFITGLVAQVSGTWVLHPICIALFAVMFVLWWGMPKVDRRAE